MTLQLEAIVELYECGYTHSTHSWYTLLVQSWCELHMVLGTTAGVCVAGHRSWHSLSLGSNTVHVPPYLHLQWLFSYVDTK